MQMKRWTEQELDSLMGYEGFGDKDASQLTWKKIAEKLNEAYGTNRTANACKKKWWKRYLEGGEKYGELTWRRYTTIKINRREI